MSVTDAEYKNLALAESQAQQLKIRLGWALSRDDEAERRAEIESALVSLRVVAACLGQTVAPIREPS